MIGPKQSVLVGLFDDGVGAYAALQDKVIGDIESRSLGIPDVDMDARKNVGDGGNTTPNFAYRYRHDVRLRAHRTEQNALDAFSVSRL
jgi:hypothetical protein